jgi:peptidoglycan/xylan/chitin deacetylase (PgdA/CDA1 family)
MTRVRILVLSGARPLRARRIAERISSDMPDFEICGVVQHTLRQLPWSQQRIATGDIGIGFGGQVSSKTSLRIRKILSEIIHWLLWCVHGCPRGMRANTSFTVEDLASCCRQSGWPFVVADDLSGEEVVEFARGQRPDLVIILGEPLLSREMLDVPALGLTRVLAHDSSHDPTVLLQKGTDLKVEYLARGSGCVHRLVSLALPTQIHDGLLSKTLKSDLIADDLLVHAVTGLGKRSQTRASKEIQQWIQRALAPCLNQFEARQPSSAQQEVSYVQRHRSILKLCVQSLLCFPWVIGRNLYRRLRSRYPVLILAHHLVSDRPHAMGITTEDLWRRIHFLQRQYRIVGLSEAGELLRSGSVSAPTVVLTFDDGYCDNYITLRAVAEETGAKIVLFLATGQIELRQEFDHDLATGTRNFVPLTWPQVEDWSQRDIEFGGHTRTHFDCGSSDRARLETEIVGSRKDLEIRLGRPCRFFAFPFGKRENISPEAMQIAASTYSSVLSSYGGENLPRKGQKQQHLLRKGFYSDPWELELEMQSVFDLVQSSRSRLQRSLSGLRSGQQANKPIRRWPWTLLHACLVLLAVVPPFRRLLDEISADL